MPLGLLGRIEALLVAHSVDAFEVQDGDTMTRAVAGMDAGRLGVVVYAEGRERATTLADAAAAVDPEVHAEALPFADTSWTEVWKEFIPASVIADRVVVRPPFRPSPRPDLPEVVIDPGLAFGTGSHETTRLACRLALDAVGDRSGRRCHSVADIGCGTGVVAAVLARVAGARVDACDNDPEAVRVAHEVLSANGLRDLVRVREGSARDALEGRYGLVVANILGEILLSIAPDLLSRCEPGGALVLSGVLRSDEDTFLSSLLAHGRLAVERVVNEGEWSGFWLRVHER